MAVRAPQEAVGRPRASRGLGSWLDQRFGLGALRYDIPVHGNSLAYTLGGLTAGTFLLLVATGIYLAQFYDPQAEAAYASVSYIIEQAPTGRLVRSLHFWLSDIFIVALIVHLLRTFVTGSYKRPREGIWLVGVVLFAVAGGLLFTGTVMKDDQEAVEALAHNSAIADFLGFLGFWFSNDFAGNVNILVRDYIAHVSILPLVFAGALVVHLLLVKRLRLSPLPWGTAGEVEERERDERRLPFTTHLTRIGLWTAMALALALLLSAIWPVGLGPEGVEGIEVTKPPWYFIWLYPLENWFGLKALAIFPAVLMGGLALIPFLDRSRERDPRRRRFWMALGALVLGAWIAFTIYAYLTVPVSHVGM